MALYEKVHAAPFALNAILLFALVAYAYGDKALRRSGLEPATEAQTTQAALDYADGAGGSAP